MNYLSFLMDPWIASIIIFVVFIAYLLWKDRNNIEREGILIVRRTEKGLRLINRIAKFSPRFWKVVSTIGVFVSIGAMFVILYLIINNVLNVFLLPTARPEFALVLPTYSTNASINPGLAFIPFWYWIIGLATVVVAHEMMHGIVGRAEDFPLKSVGWAILGVLPAAFVEPEGEEMLPEEDEDGEKENKEGGPWTQGSWIGRLRVLAAGSFSNIVLGVVVLFVLVNLIAPGTLTEFKGLYEYNGVDIKDLNNKSPAYRAGLRENMTITKFNGVEIDERIAWGKARSNLSLNRSTEIIADNRTYQFVPQTPPESNLTYNPAPVDYFLVFLEREFPGTIESYENNNDFLVPEDREARLGRWIWIRDNFEELEERAESKINKLKGTIEKKESPWIGLEDIEWNRKVNKAYIGFEGVLNFLTRALLFIFIFNLGVGAANMLPIKPLDGGHIVETISERYAPSKSEFITKLLSYGTLSIIVFGFAIYYTTWMISFLS